MSAASAVVSRRVYFVTHPNVVVDPSMPVTEWPLSDLGRERMVRALRQPWIRDLTAIYCSAERKARDGAAIIAASRALPYTVCAGLGENDRSSTGFLPPAEFERTADAFFANPQQSVRGWETAAAAQRRVVDAVVELIARDATRGSIVIVAHGAVGTLLYCHLAGEPIDRRWDQPANGGGNYFAFPLATMLPDSAWQPIDAPLD